MKQQKGISLIVLVLIIIILFVVVSISTYIILSRRKSDNIEDNTLQTNVIENTNTFQENESNNITENSSIDIVKLEEDLDLSYNENGAFLMTIDNVYTWAGHGTMVEGTILRGIVKAGDTVQILGMDSDTKTTTIARVEQSRTEISEGKIGEIVTVLLSDYDRNEIIVGQVLAQENSILVSNNIQVSAQMNNSKNIEILKNLKDLKCFIRNIEIPIEIDSNTEIEENVINIHLENSIAVEKEMKFTIKNNNDSIAECTIIDIY